MKSRGILLQSSWKKKERLEQIVQGLTIEPDALATQAETKNKMELMVKSNVMSSKSREKRKEMENEEKNIDMVCRKSLKANVKVDLAYLIIHLM